MKLSEVKEKVLKGELVIENDMPRSKKTIKVLNYIEKYTWSGVNERYGADSESSFRGLLKNELIDVPHIKVSQIDLEEEVTYTREQAEQVLKDFNSFTDETTLNEEGLHKYDIAFLKEKFNTEEKTLEELKTYYEEKEGKKVIIKSK